MYELIRLTAFRRFRMSNMNDIDRMTLEEYLVLLKASELKWLDDEYFIHLQAYKNQDIQAVRGKGKHQRPYYKDFNAFFPYEKLRDDILGVKKVISEDDKKMMYLMRDLNKKGG